MFFLDKSEVPVPDSGSSGLTGPMLVVSETGTAERTKPKVPVSYTGNSGLDGSSDASMETAGGYLW